MGEKIKIDLVVAQKIIDEKQGDWAGAFSPFLKVVADEYNSQQATSLDYQVFGLRIKSNLLQCEVKSGSKHSPMTAEHKEKFFEGRKKAQDEPVKPKTISYNNQKANERLIEMYADEYPNLLKKVLNGSLSSSVKLHCLQCCVGQKKEITNCVVFSCPLYTHRPFQKEIEEDDDQC